MIGESSSTQNKTHTHTHVVCKCATALPSARLSLFLGFWLGCASWPDSCGDFIIKICPYSLTYRVLVRVDSNVQVYIHAHTRTLTFVYNDAQYYVQIDQKHVKYTHAHMPSSSLQEPHWPNAADTDLIPTHSSSRVRSGHICMMMIEL